MRRLIVSTVFITLALTPITIIGCGDTSCGDTRDCSAYTTPDGSTDGNLDASPGIDVMQSDGPSPGADASDATSDTSVSCDAATAIMCSGACVDSTQPAHCGSCSNVCTAPTHGQATCTVPSTCGITCDATYHACNGNCLPDSNEPSMDACVVSDALGVFVSPSGNDANACTKAAPCKTIGHGMTVAKTASKRTYVCEGTYDEQLIVDTTLDDVNAFGGFACGTWTYDVNKKPLVAPTAHGYAMVISTPTSALFEDFAFQSQAGTASGESSIAVFAKNATGVVMRRCNITAGNTAHGADPMQPAPYSSAAPSGNTSTGAGGGTFVQNPACTTSVSGAGGQATLGGQDGTDGAPGASNKGTAVACIAMGTPAGFGASGSTGAGGAGASTWASLTTGGWTPTSGGTGGTGTVGEGGGGGASADTTGGGGGGGAGGCGGAAGPAGTGGGSAIALLSLSSTLDLEACAVTAGNAGRGGNGAAGQIGQTGGPKGNGFVNACAGGKGGNGGNGATGGGGAGGLSAGIVWLGTAPRINGTSTPSAATLSGVTIGSPGGGGTGGNAGKVGVAAAVVQFQ